MTLCGGFEAYYARKQQREKAQQRFRSRPLFEQIAWLEEEWRTRGEEAIKAEMEVRIRAWLLTAKAR